MSDDLYDSLEDESHDGKTFCDPFYLHQKESVPAKRVSKMESITRHSSFCFGKVVDKEGLDFSPSFKGIPVNHQHVFLPDIKKRKSLQGDLHKVLTESVDYAALAEKGLLLNEDGSFTKSPRLETEELPFITREYKNLVLQKQKTYDLKKKNAALKRQKSKLSEKDLSKTVAEKSFGKSSSFRFAESTTKANGNLTDSMKRILLQEENQKNGSHCGLPRQIPKFCHSEITRPLNKLPEGNDVVKGYQPLNRQMSQITLDTQKRRLTYAERQQLQNGYSPLFLRYGIKKITSETTRSNFGDSITGRLSDVSSQVFSAKSLSESEDEEKFYKDIIKMDKNKVERSDVPGRLFYSTHRSLEKTGSLRELEKLQRSGKSNPKQSTKSLFIDLKASIGKAAQNSKKCSHNCPKHPAAKLSKTELVLKGKAYGYMANARNILKFKSQDKLSERESLSFKIDEGFRKVYKQDSEHELSTKHLRSFSPRLSLTLKKKNEKEQTEHVSNDWSSRGWSSRKDDRKQGFYLPHVTNSENRDISATSLLRKHCCLYGPFC